MLYLIEQCLNGIQLGMLLFLLAAGLTLIVGGSWLAAEGRLPRRRAAGVVPEAARP